MKSGTMVFIYIVLLLNFQPAIGAENEYGIAKAWFNVENATVNGAQLKIGEPFVVKLELLSKIRGDVSFKLYEPGVTKAFKVLNGPSEVEKRIDNMNVESGWLKTYSWTIAPNGDWKGGNAPLNVIIQFNKGMINKQIDFTIANPYILDEQYSGAVPTPVTTAPPAETQTKEAPFVPVIFAVGTLFLAWRCRREKT